MHGGWEEIPVDEKCHHIFGRYKVNWWVTTHFVGHGKVKSKCLQREISTSSRLEGSGITDRSNRRIGNEPI